MIFASSKWHSYIYIYDICKLINKKSYIHEHTHRQTKRYWWQNRVFAHLYMLEHMFFLYAPSPCGKRTCSAFTEFCRTSESNLRLAASLWFEKHGSAPSNLGKWLKSHGEMRIALPVCFFWDAKIPGIDCSWVKPHDFWRIWKILDYWTVDFILRNIK